VAEIQALAMWQVCRYWTYVKSTHTSVYLISQLRVLIDSHNHCTPRPIWTSKPGSGTQGSSGMPETYESESQLESCGGIFSLRAVLKNQLAA